MSRIDTVSSHPPDAHEGIAARLIRGPLAVALAGLALLQLATWLPHYLTWPFWADHDVYATLAQGWDRGWLPYRDLACNNFPGTIYLFWILGRVAGWGQTLPFYAFDAALVVLFGAAMLAWSQRQCGRLLPGLVGYTAFLSYYLSQDYCRAGQHDWHAVSFAIMGIMTLQCASGRAVRWFSAAALAAAVITRPQTVLFLPAVAFALDERARQNGEPLRRSAKAVLEWGAAFTAFVLLGFAPLAVAGVLPDFVHGVRLASYGSSYNLVTPGTVVSGWVTQLSPLRFTVVPLALWMFHRWVDPAANRTALTWCVALGGVSLYKPLSPVPHGYLDFPLVMVWTINLALLARLALAGRELTPTLRLAFLLFLVALGTTVRPTFCMVSNTIRTIAALSRGNLPHDLPAGYRSDMVRSGAYYRWEDYRGVLEYLRRETQPGTHVANVLKGDSALTGPSGRLPAFPAESITWLRMVNPKDEARFAEKLETDTDSVVVWVPGEVGPFGPQPLSLIMPVIERHYAPEAKFGDIEVWRRKPGSHPAGVASR